MNNRICSLIVCLSISASLGLCAPGPNVPVATAQSATEASVSSVPASSIEKAVGQANKDGGVAARVMGKINRRAAS